MVGGVGCVGGVGGEFSQTVRQPVGLKIEIHKIHQKDKSNVSSHVMKGFLEIQYCIRNLRIRTHSVENI